MSFKRCPKKKSYKRPKNVLCFGQFEVRLVRFITFIRYQNVSAVRGGWDTSLPQGLPLLRHVFSFCFLQSQLWRLSLAITLQTILIMCDICFRCSGLSSPLLNSCNLQVIISIFLAFALLSSQYLGSQGYYSQFYYKRTSNVTLKTLNQPWAVELSARLTKSRISSKRWTTNAP